jgi:hypothetical protein
MKVKLKEYLSSKDTLLRAYEENGINKAVEAAVVSGCNLVAFYTFLNEKYPCKEFEDKIKFLSEFYNYEGVE